MLKVKRDSSALEQKAYVPWGSSQSVASGGSPVALERRRSALPTHEPTGASPAYLRTNLWIVN
jgi:hypothetical protein